MSDQQVQKKKSAGSKKDVDKSQGSVKSKQKKQKDESQFKSQNSQELHNNIEQQPQIDLVQPQVFQGTSSFPQQQANDMQIIPKREDPIPKCCIHHQQQFIFFCETCEEPICQQCTILGPHNNQLHRINRINDAYKLRCLKIQEQIKANLLTKREQLLAQIHRIEYRIEEIKYVKTIIERDARAEYGGILERLKSSEGSKLALLHHEIAELQHDLDSINELGSQFYELTSGDSQDICLFLLRSRDIYENIEYIVAKPFKVQIEVYPYDLPRELTELRLQLQKANAQKQLLDFKNEVIWKLISDKKVEEDQLKQELEKQATEEIAEWSKLVDKFSLELKKFQQVCFYCGCRMEKQFVNGNCVYNGTEQQERAYSSEQPPEEFNGNGRHFFGKPFE